MKHLIAMLLLGVAVPGLAFAQTDSAPSLTASHARSAMTDFGCTSVTTLGVAPDGSYHGQCTKAGSVINVMMDKTGKVSQLDRAKYVTEGQARYAMADFGCNNVSALGTGPGGTWYGQCTKGGSVVDVMVDSKGVASAGKASHITEAKARSMLLDYGCNNLSTLTMGADGAWYGQCTKGGSTQRVSVSSTGQMAAK